MKVAGLVGNWSQSWVKGQSYEKSLIHSNESWTRIRDIGTIQQRHESMKNPKNYGIIYMSLYIYIYIE